MQEVVTNSQEDIEHLVVTLQMSLIDWKWLKFTHPANWRIWLVLFKKCILKSACKFHSGRSAFFWTVRSSSPDFLEEGASASSSSVTFWVKSSSSSRHSFKQLCKFLHLANYVGKILKNTQQYCTSGCRVNGYILHTFAREHFQSSGS